MTPISELIACVVIFVGAPGIVSYFIYAARRSKSQTEKMKYERDIRELEVRKEELRLQALQEENKKYDRLLDEKSHPEVGIPPLS